MEIILYKLTQFFLMLLLGYGLARVDMIQKQSLIVLSQLVTKVFLPAFTFCSIYSGNSKKQLTDGSPILFITFFLYLIMASLFYLLAKAIGLKGERRQIFQALFIFGNTGFVGFPIVQSLYGSEGSLYMALFSIVDQAILWSYGIWLCNTRNGGKFRIKNLLNPCMAAIITAIIFLLTDIQIPAILLDTAASIGNANTGVCMIYLGSLLFYSHIRTVLKEKELYIGIAAKMLILPICVRVVLYSLISNTVMREILVILSALPTMTVIPILAKNGSGEGEYAAGVTMVTLIASLMTLSLVAALVM